MPDEVYRANYKLASIPFWCCVAYIEQSLLDMLGKIAAKPVGALLGGVVRTEIPVYLSGSDRVLSAEEEVAVYERGVAATGALWAVGQGAWLAAASLFALGTIGFAAANVFYDSLLLDVAAPEELDRVSAYGYSLGYLGAGCCSLSTWR